MNENCTITKQGTHDAIAKLEVLVKQNPSAEWAKDWIDCLSYFCSCSACRRRIKESQLDTKMLDGVFDI